MGIFQNIFKNQEKQPKQNIKPGFTVNSASMSYGNWIRSGHKGTMFNNTADVNIEPQHLYRGYGYGIIKSIANTGIVTAEENVRTTCSSLQRELLAKTDAQIEHPYKKLWQNSPYFSEYEFWKKYFTYIQLKGEFYIYMNRTKLSGSERYRKGTHNLTGKTAYMKIINPYEMQPHEYDEEGNVKTWLRTIKAANATGKDLVQKIPAYQIIRIAEDDPWNDNQPYSLLDATKENLYTLENAKDYTRHALVNNINTPGMLSVNGEFATQEEFDNYVAMLRNHEEGEMIIAAGNAETQFQDMNQNLDGASQEKIRAIERDEIFVTAGASKSVLGIETSGLTRDVAATQKLTFVERTVVPYIKLMLETLNYDYRVNYAGDFMIDKYILRVTNPSIGDKAQEEKELEIREQEYAMVQKFVDRGYTRKSAAQYVRGEIDVEQLQLENGDKVRLSANESVELVDAAERWQALLQAGNDAQSIIDLINGEISMAEFIEINKDVEFTPEETTTGPEEEPESKGDLKEPGEYYDPAPEDYSTPRDMKDTPADKTRKKAREEDNAIAIEVIMNEMNVDEEDAEKILSSGDITKSVRCKIMAKVDKAHNDKIKQEVK